MTFKYLHPLPRKAGENISKLVDLIEQHNLKENKDYIHNSTTDDYERNSTNQI